MQKLPFDLDPDELRAVFEPNYLERGARYLREGRVLSADYNPAQGLASGRVRGSGARVYQCIVQLPRHDSDAPDLFGQCSCPVGQNCKHVAAVLLSLARQHERVPPPMRTDGLPPELRNWLARVEQTAVAGPVEEDPNRLVYLFRTEVRGGINCLLLRAVKAPALATGGYGKPQEFDLFGRYPAGLVTRDDRRIRALLQAETASEAGAEAVLDQAAGAELLQAIAQTGRGHWYSPEGPALRLADAVRGRLVWRLGDDTRLHVVLESERADLELLPLMPPWYLDPASGDCGPLMTGLGEREAGLLAMAPAVAPESADALLDAARARLKGMDLPLPKRPERRRVSAGRPLPCLRLHSEDRAAGAVRRYWGAPAEPDWTHHATLRFDYGGIAVDPRDPSGLVQRVEAGVLVESERDRNAEREAAHVLHAAQFQPEPDRRGDEGPRFGLADDQAWLHFMGHEADGLRAAGWRIEATPQFRFQVVRLGDWQMDIAEADGGHWLDLGLGVELDGERLDLLPLLVDMIRRYQVDLSPQKLAQQEDDAVLPLRLDDQRLILMPAGRLRPILTTLIELYDPEQPLTEDGRLRLPRLQAAQLAELEDAASDLRLQGGDDTRAWGRRLRDFHGLEQVALPNGLGAELRPYQRQGLDWLQFLRQYELAGILADDMGLGKTLQTLAHLLLEKQSGRADRPSLVVAPTSLMFNWKREAERFAPALSVLLLHGADRRERFAAIAEHDLVLTTYALLPRDLDALSACTYHLLILDEAQAIKNPRSKAGEAARVLEARHRLCLTGTPLENHLGELWALFDFLLPGLLGDERRFRRLFRNPIERLGDQVRQDQLRRRVAPFLLRRTKDAVAGELPPKTEILREVPLANDQRDLYETLRLALHEKVRAEVARKGLARSGIIILDALLKLRQVCCDPRLVPLEGARKVKGSAKLELLMALLPELLEEGRRILLFSQFTSMLALIEAELMTSGLRENQQFVKLTGQTRNRSLPVDRFQAGEIPLFLISLKAGGSGLNLTAADTVIHYDPWWNPAAERQATDRAHRIGQDKPVFVYKLLTEGTVEQRVADLQARKQALADAMLAGGGAAAGALSAEDLDLLFAPVAD